MSVSLSAAKITVDIEAIEQGAQEMGLSKITHRPRGGLGALVLELANGTGDNQSDRVWSSSGSLVSTTVDIDLAGTLTSKLDGSVVTFVEITAIFIRNKSTTSGAVLTVGAGSNPLITWLLATGDGIKIGPSGCVLLTNPLDGYVVTASTGDILRLNSGSSTIAYEIIIIGRSA